MLVTFRSKAYSDITMFGDVALTLIKLMGHSGTIPSALKPEQVPSALKKLTDAIEQGAQMTDTNDEDDDDSSDKNKVPVSLKHRALPLVELLEAAAEQKEHVMWDS